MGRDNLFFHFNLHMQGESFSHHQQHPLLWLWYLNDSASTVLLRIPSGMIITLLESHYEKTRICLKYESHSITIWRRPKGWEGETLHCFHDFIFINTPGLLQNYIRMCEGIFLWNKIHAHHFCPHVKHDQFLNNINLNKNQLLAAIRIYSLLQWWDKSFGGDGWFSLRFHS